MDREEFERVMEELDRLSGDAYADFEHESETLGEDHPRAMYFLGKESGVNRAKDVLRRLVDVEGDE